MTPGKLRVLIVAQLVTITVAAGAIGWVLIKANGERMGARRDACVLIVGLARAAAGNSPKALAAANAYIDRTQLHDCNAYAQDPTAKPGGKP